MEARTITVPPAFDPAKWQDPDAPQPPDGYTGLRVSFDVVAEMIRPCNDDLVVILGMAIPAVNIQFDPPQSDRNHPVLFEATGRRFHYEVSYWQDRFEILIFDLPTDGSECGPFVGARFPETELELLVALQVIVADCSE